MPTVPRTTLTLVALALLVTLTSLVAPSHAAAQDGAEHPPFIRDLQRACPQGHVPTSPFDRVYDTYRDDVDCMVWYGITSGVSPTEFGHRKSVRRGQMATFIVNLLDYAAGSEGVTALPPYDGTNSFPDAADSVHVANINRLADAGVVRGGPSGLPSDRFGPRMRVRRDQMATFLNGAQGFLTGTQLQSADDYFTDDDGNVHEDNINAMAEHGVTGGYGDGRYGGGDRLARQQMAAFVMRIVDLNVHAGRVTTPARRDTDPANQDFFFDEVVDTAQVSFSDVTDEGETEFSVTSVGQEPVSIALFRCWDVFHDGSLVGFRDDATPAHHADHDADGGAVIESVNGEDVLLDRGRYVSDVTPEDGRVTFTVDSTTADCVTAAVLVDGDADEALDLDAENRPTEKFAVSDPLRYLPPTADTAGAAVTVVLVDPAGKQFVGEAAGEQVTYGYSDLDDFTVDDATSPFAEFDLRVSQGDTVTPTRAGDAERWTFDLDDGAPAPPADVTAAVTDITATIAWTPSPTGTVTGYDVYRLTCDLDNGEEIRGFPELVAHVSARLNRAVDEPLRVWRYCYEVRAVDAGDTSRPSEVSNAIEVSEFEMVDAVLTRDRGRAGVLDAGDQARFAHNRPVDPNSFSTGHSQISLLGRDESNGRSGEVDLWCARGGGEPNVDCTVNDGEVIVDGTAYAPGEVVIIDVHSVDNEQRLPLLVDNVPFTDHAGSPVADTVPLHMPSS